MYITSFYQEIEKNYLHTSQKLLLLLLLAVTKL